MPGSNRGHQLNVFVFELGMINRDPLGVLPDIVLPLSVHPLVVAPTNVRYQDGSRSYVGETHAGSIIHKAGRALQAVSLNGSFGVASRGLGTLLGTGDQRFRRFRHEIVRMADAVTKAQVDAEKDMFLSPLLNLALQPYDPNRSSFYVNYYDFWHDVAFECCIPSFSFGKSFRNGGATGLTNYQMTVREVGPIITGTLVTDLVSGLFQALTTWDTINEQLKSYRVDTIVGALVDTGGILISQMEESLGAFKAQVDGATGLVNGFTPPETAVVLQSGSQVDPDSTEEPSLDVTGLSPYLGASANLAATGEELLAAVAQQNPSTVIETEAGSVRWWNQDGEGAIPAIDSADRQDELIDVIDAALFQQATGALYGMSRAEYQEYLSATGVAGRDASLATAISYKVKPYDTGDSIERQFAVAWDDVLRVNQLLPDEALVSGRTLLIPQQRAAGQQPNVIDGLPVFGSHTGHAALGSDLYVDLRADSNGGFAVVSGEECLQQGLDWTINRFGDELLKFLNDTPIVVSELAVAKRVSVTLLSDRRVASVDDVQTSGTSGVVEVSATVTAINGSQVSSGRAA